MNLSPENENGLANKTELKPFDPADQKRIDSLNAKFESPQKRGVFSKMHNFLLGSILAAGVSSVSAGEHNKSVELFSNSPVDKALQAPVKPRKVPSNSQKPEVTRPTNNSAAPNQSFSNSSDPEENRRANDINRPKSKEYFSN